MVRYVSWRAASRMADRHAEGGTRRPYRCAGSGFWHLTSPTAPAFREPAPEPASRYLSTSERARIRDIPAHCACRWRYAAGAAHRWVRVQPSAACPWHLSAARRAA